MKVGAGRIRGGQKPVEIHAGVFARRVPLDVRLAVHVEGGRTDHAEHFAGFVVVNAHRSLIAAQRLEGGG